MRRTALLTLAGTLALAGLFLSVRAREDSTLQNSLVDLGILPAVSGRAVLFPDARPLTGTLTTPVLRATEGPYVLRGAVEIPRAVTVRLEPGTVLLAAEGSSLTVFGYLHGTDVSFGSNERRETKRLWHGIQARDGATVDLRRTTIRDATSALVCGPGGTVFLKDSLLAGNAAGFVSLPKSRACVARAVLLEDSRVGFQLVGGSPQISDVTLTRVADGFRIFHDARPSLAGLTVRHAAGTVLAYAAPPPLVIRGLSVTPPSSLRDLLVDGASIPTHRVGGVSYPTGRVLVR